MISDEHNFQAVTVRSLELVYLSNLGFQLFARPAATFSCL